MRLTALTIVFGLHAVEGGGARRAPAPSEAGDLAAGRDMATALYERCELCCSLWLPPRVECGLITARCAEQLLVQVALRFVS